jgi:3-phosphoshikimate 1-carboxyvinyltransferase
MFDKVTIIGLGLMGGSAAKALKKKRLARRVWAFARSQKSLKRYKKLRLVDAVTRDLDAAVRDAEIILLCAPPSAILYYLQALSRLNLDGALIMDMGSVKTDIMRCAQKLFAKKNNFVGAHPMSGSEKSGAGHADAGLYEGNACFLVPLKKNHFFKKALKFWRSLGSKPVVIGPFEHDRIVAAISHLPHLLAFSLVAFVPRTQARFAAGGYTSISRLALSDPELWADILTANKKHLVKTVREYARRLLGAASCIEHKRKEEVESLLKENSRTV